MPSTKNRTLWPVGGGAVGFQPGWFNGHASAFLYINLGDGTLPENFSMIMQPVFEITGPQNTIYPGSICLPHVSLPVNYTAVIGHNATIQVIELAQHGAALYNVSPLPPPPPLPDLPLHTRNRTIHGPWSKEKGKDKKLIKARFYSAWTSPSQTQKTSPKSTKATAPTPRTSASSSSSAPRA